MIEKQLQVDEFFHYGLMSVEADMKVCPRLYKPFVDVLVQLDLFI